MRGSVGRQQGVQILAGRLRIAKVKLHGLPFLHDVANGDCSGRLIGADQVPDEKIPPLEPITMFIDGNAEMQGPMGMTPVLFRQGFKHRLEPFQGRNTAKLMNEIVLGFCDDEPVADQPAPL